MLPIITSPTTPTTPSCVCAHDGHDHALIRCGCSNERVHTHGDPMQHADDAFHRVWCCTCMSYCSKDEHCPLPLPSLAAAVVAHNNQSRNRSMIIDLSFQLLLLPFHLFASIRVWLGNALLGLTRPTTSTSQKRPMMLNEKGC